MVVVPTLIMDSVTLLLSLCLINTGIHDSEYDGYCPHPHHGLRHPHFQPLLLLSHPLG
jgi:hypothetical protein